MVYPLVKIYFGYSLAIGITSRKLANQRFYSTLFSRTYALVANIITLTVLPFVMWQVRLVFETKMHFPQLILITYNVRYLVSYAVISYTVLSRGFRDIAFNEMQPLLQRLLQKESRCSAIRCGRKSLIVLIYVKFFTIMWLCLTETIFLFYSSEPMNIVNIARFIFLTNASNILNMVPMGYFLAMWHIARGFDNMNQRLDKIITSKSSKHLKELQELWLLHTDLTKTALRINKIYGPQMLASRFDNFIIGVIQAYWGAFFTFRVSTPIFWIVYGSVQYQIRALDYYLNDYLTDLVVEYQSSAKHSWSEIHWTKETSSYVIYANSLKLQLRTCGLFPANRSMWFDMVSGIWYYILVLLQFHFIMEK
ncbi:putative gustatory receptor 59b [Drosophila subpulchrella]|uniref:putative gustatory receptor 59b n=1 Tax=Drosophila subpulchrella TaxID=1486046 RepID=UPI0018A19205|nr:putative gustatory receptor 59b [Drosophila subpulchrella]